MPLSQWGRTPLTPAQRPDGSTVYVAAGNAEAVDTEPVPATAEDAAPNAAEVDQGWPQTPTPDDLAYEPDDDELGFTPPTTPGPDGRLTTVTGENPATSWQPADRFAPTVPSGDKARIEANMAAVRVLGEITEQGRAATAAEQAILARWSSWGAVPQVFDPRRIELLEVAGELRGLVGEDGYAQANRTVRNAHYTDPSIVAAMWDHLRDLGFTEGQVLEPGSGSGNFIGAAPAGAHMTGVEVDRTTAAISALLYPQATIRNESFADTAIPEGSFDAAVGNVPFADTKLLDPVYNAGNHAMHNHFIIKALGLTRPGGVVAVITSHYTMDAQNPAAREEIAAMADFLGAVRLPTGAHKRTAGTDALTDVLILRRRDGDPIEVGGDFTRTVARTLPGELGGERDVRINEYFADHPEMVLGDMSVGTGMYSANTLNVRATEPDTAAALRARLATIAHTALEAGASHNPRPMAESERRAIVRVGTSPAEFPGHITTTTDGFTIRAVTGTDQELTVPKTQQRELAELLGLRDATIALLEAEAATAQDTTEISGLRAELNRRYDAYVDRFGPVARVWYSPTGRVDEQTGEPVLSIRRPPVMRTFREDPHAQMVLALEDYDATTGVAKKMAIMQKRVVAPRAPRLGADTPADALAICVDTFGRIDLEHIADLLGVSEQEAREQIRGLVYADPDKDGELVPAAEYLSGDVRTKLEHAEAAALTDPEHYSENVEPLREVIPDDLGPAEIDARLGAVWIGPEDVQLFLQEVLRDTNESITVEHKYGAEWSVRSPIRNLQACEEYGTRRRHAGALAEALLKQSQIRVYDELDAGGRVLNAEETLAANEKAAALDERFSEWVWENPQRAQRLAAVYNRRFNNIVLRNYATDHMSLPGLSAAFTPRPHQLSAVARMIAEPNVGLFHAVGAGKTLEMAMGVMELRRLGLVNKPALVVPNHMLDQFSREFLQAYPQARVLAAGQEDLKGDKRRAFVARAALGDWDAIIMTRSSFGRLPVSKETMEGYFDRELRQQREYLRSQLAANANDAKTVKKIEQSLQNLEEKLKKKMAGPVDPGITFEQTGIDYLVVDELQDYKNLATPSHNQQTAIDGSERASMLHMKVEYLRHKYNGRAMTGATATPIANSITEAYVMQRYLRPDLLEAAGIDTFDRWAKTFASVSSELEMSVDGNTWSMKDRFSKFRNVPELLKMWHVAADVKLPEDLNLPVPALKQREDGKRLPRVVTVAPTPELLDYIAELGRRAEEIRNKTVDKRDDNMLKLSSDGRKAALSMRLVEESGDDNDLFTEDLENILERDQNKITAAADNITRIWAENKDRSYLDVGGEVHPRPGALQIVFCDLSTPKPEWNVYDELKNQLIARGVPADQIAFIHDAKTDTAKAAMFEAARTGQIQVLIGSTAKMGVGTNVQNRAAALHHLDCPWRPDEVEQREGRILRQGNQNPEVEILRYVTEGSFDARMWATIARKASFIGQVMKGNLDVREIEEIPEQTMTANEAVALASGNPLVLEKAEVDAEVGKLERLRRAHARGQTLLEHTLRTAEERIPQLKNDIAVLAAAITARIPTRGEQFAATIGGRHFDKRVDAGNGVAVRLAELVADRSTLWKDRSLGVIGRLGGFDLTAHSERVGRDVLYAVGFPDIGAAQVVFTRDQIANGGAPLIGRVENALEGLDRLKATYEKQLTTMEADAEQARSRIGVPFPKASELASLRERKKEIDVELAGTPETEPEANDAEKGQGTKPGTAIPPTATDPKQGRSNKPTTPPHRPFDPPEPPKNGPALS